MHQPSQPHFIVQSDVGATDFNGFTALHWLASNGRAAPLELLLDDGFDISTQDRHSRVRWHGNLWMLQARLTYLHRPCSMWLVMPDT